jgi:hypothetical protein
MTARYMGNFPAPAPAVEREKEMKRLHTVEHTENGLTIKITQRVTVGYNGGHYDWAILRGGDLLATGSTCGGAPRGIVEEQDAAWRLNRWMRELDSEDRELYGLDKEA